MIRLKILQVFDFFSLPRGGGTVDIVYKLSRTLSNRGHSVSICTGDYELDKDYIDSLAGVDVKVFRSWFNRFGVYIIPGLLRFPVEDYDIIHFHCYRSIQSAVLIRKAVKHSVPFVIDAHGSTVRLNDRKRVFRWVYDRVFGNLTKRYAKYFIAETTVGVAEYKALGVPEPKIKVLHPLLDMDEFANLSPRGIFRRQYSIGNRRMILFMGRVHPAKAIYRLLATLAYLDTHYTDQRFILVVAGQDDNGYTRELTAQREQYGLPLSSVLFTGFLTGVDKLSALVDADVLVQPSVYEAGARPSLEAILCGSPAIVNTGTGAGRELQDLDCGYLVDCSDPKVLADLIYRITTGGRCVQNKVIHDRDVIQANLSLPEHIARYENLYREALA